MWLYDDGDHDDNNVNDLIKWWWQWWWQWRWWYRIRWWWYLKWCDYDYDNDHEIYNDDDDDDNDDDDGNDNDFSVDCRPNSKINKSHPKRPLILTKGAAFISLTNVKIGL